MNNWNEIVYILSSICNFDEIISSKLFFYKISTIVIS